MSRYSKLDSLSGNLFFTAIVINRIGKFTIPIVSHVCFVISTLLYLCGYVFWKASVYEDECKRHQFSKKHKEEFDRQFQHSHYYRYTAFFGVISCILALFSLVNPITAVISAWLFFVSNSFWYKAEGITLKRLQDDTPNSIECRAQKRYLRYTRLSTLISLITPIVMTLCLIFPAIAVPLTSITALYVIAFNLLAIMEWIKSGATFKKVTDKSTALSRIEKNADLPKPTRSSYLHIIKSMPPGEGEDEYEKIDEVANKESSHTDYLGSDDIYLPPAHATLFLI